MFEVCPVSSLADYFLLHCLMLILPSVIFISDTTFFSRSSVWSFISSIMFMFSLSWNLFTITALVYLSTNYIVSVKPGYLLVGSISCLFFFFKDLKKFIFREREGREKGREQGCVRQPACPDPGTWPAAPGRRPDWDPAGHLSVGRAKPSWATPAPGAWLVVFNWMPRVKNFILLCARLRWAFTSILF